MNNKLMNQMLESFSIRGYENVTAENMPRLVETLFQQLADAPTAPAPEEKPAPPVFGYMRVVSGQSFQIMEGTQRPPDRSGNGAGPWFAIYRQPPASAAVPEHDDYFASLVAMARVAADRAMKKFPQPNYVLTKVSEEHGEVIKAVVHYLEGRETWENVEGELVDNLAMLIRLVVEGDQVIGFTPPESVLNYQPAAPAAATELKPLEWTEERQPDEDIRYNHVIADSVLGRFSVEWKGWKDYDSRVLYLAGEYIDSFHSVDEAKAGAAAHLLKIYNSLAGK